MLVDVDRGQHIVLDEALAQDDRVFKVVATPWHKGHKQVFAKCEFAPVSGWAVADELALLNFITEHDSRLVVDAGVLVRTVELRQHVCVAAELCVVDHNRIAVDFSDGAVVERKDHVGGIVCGTSLDTGTDVGSFCSQQWHSLALHVRTHQGAVCIVVLKERDKCSSDRNDLLWRNVHHLDFFAGHVRDLGGSTEEDILFKLQSQPFEGCCLW